MRDAVFRALIRPILISAIRDVADDPRRAIRGLLEKARPFVDAKTYEKLSAMAAAVARDEANCAILRRIAVETDPEILVGAAACAACGALRCMERLRRSGTLPRWHASFNLDATPRAVLDRLISEQKQRGTFVFFLHGRSMPVGLTRLLYGKECLFLLFLREAPGAEEARRLAVCGNAAVFVECATPEALEKTKVLAQRRCLWGVYTGIHADDAANLAPWARMVSERAMIACVGAAPDCGKEFREAVDRAVREFRHAPDVPLFLINPDGDLDRIDRAAAR